MALACVPSKRNRTIRTSSYMSMCDATMLGVAADGGHAFGASYFFMAESPMTDSKKSIDCWSAVLLARWVASVVLPIQL